MKRIFFPFLMTLCILGFTACGNAENSSPVPNEAPVQTEAVSLETQKLPAAVDIVIITTRRTTS